MMQNRDGHIWHASLLTSSHYHHLLNQHHLNSLQLPYTIFAAPALCSALKITSRAYRLLSPHKVDSLDPSIVLVVRL